MGDDGDDGDDADKDDDDGDGHDNGDDGDDGDDDGGDDGGDGYNSIISHTTLGLKIYRHAARHFQPVTDISRTFPIVRRGCRSCF